MGLPTFLQLKKNCKADASQLPTYRLAILGDSATQLLSVAMKGYAYEAGLNLELWEADYYQIDAQVLTNDSELYAAGPQGVLLYQCSEKLYAQFCQTPLEKRERFAQQVFDRIQMYWHTIRTQGKAKVFQFTFAELDDGVFGSYANMTACSFLYQVKRLNLLLMEACVGSGDVFLIDINQLYYRYGRNTVTDVKLWFSSKMPLSVNILPAVAKAVVDLLLALHGKIRKCVILDLDNTLWGGVIGDDGLEGIELGDLGRGPAFSAFQRWLKELKKRGIILGVCSKNNEETAKEPFEKHPDMELRLEDISIFVANWEDKATNIKSMQQTLNIGMDSIIFLDDNPFERNLIRQLIPQITVPELPEDPALYLSFLQEQNLFETASYSEEDQKRTDQYRAEIGRVQLQQQFSDFDGYLKSLEMVATAKPFEPFFYPRISQLTQRSNQFNLRTARYTEADIAAIAVDERYLTLSFQLKDKFGEHGLVGVVILEKQPGQTLFIDTWLMSCRVLKRGMEEFIINQIMETTEKNGYQKVIGEYLPTAKNSMVKNLYPELGFAALGDGKFEAQTGSFKKQTYIRKEEKR